MKKLMLFSIIFLFSIISFVYAGEFKVELISPANNVWINDNSGNDSEGSELADFMRKGNKTVYFNITVEGNHSGYACNLYQNWNTSITNLSFNKYANWFFNNSFTNSTGGNDINGSSNEFWVVTNEYNTSAPGVFTIANNSYGGVWLQLPETNATGFLWNAKCFNHTMTNDSGTYNMSGNESAFASSNYTVKFDITYPTVPSNLNINRFWQKSMPAVNNISDRRPTLYWTSANDSNFYRYIIYLDDSASFNHLDRTYYLAEWSWKNTSLDNTKTCNQSWSNFTTPYYSTASYSDCLYSNYSNFTIPTNLNFTNYYWGINVSDLAGNVNTTYNVTNAKLQFTIDSTCSILYTGWNLCGIVNKGGTSAWQIYQDTSATQVSIINTTNHSLFTSWITTSSPNFTIEEGQAAFIYVESQTDWRTRVWNIDNQSRLSIYNFTNASGNGFDTFMIPHRSGLTFQQLDWYFSNSINKTEGLRQGWFFNNFISAISYMSYFNNSASTSKKFTPYFHNVSWKNDTKIDYGEVIWTYTDNESFRSNRSEMTYYS